jgi:hypothetical protein
MPAKKTADHVSYYYFWKVLAGVTMGLLATLITLFAWHKETPHSGSIDRQQWDHQIAYLDKRLDRIEAILYDLQTQSKGGAVP